MIDVALRYILSETAGVQKDGDGVADGVLLTKFPGTLCCKVGYGLFYIGQSIQSLFGKRAAGADGLLVRQLFGGYTTFATQLFPCADAGNCQLALNPGFRFLSQVPSCFNALAVQPLYTSIADAPYILHRKQLQRLLPVSSALAGRVFTTELPLESKLVHIFKSDFLHVSS